MFKKFGFGVYLYATRKEIPMVLNCRKGMGQIKGNQQYTVTGTSFLIIPSGCIGVVDTNEKYFLKGGVDSWNLTRTRPIWY